MRSKDKLLFIATQLNSPALVKFSILAGGDVNSIDKEDRTALHKAAFKGSKKAIEALIENGADINSCNKNNETPLHWAAKGGNHQVIEQLIAKGASIDTQDKLGATPLHWAVLYHKGDAIKTLIKHGADVNKPDKDDKTPLYWAAHTLASDKDNNIEFLQLLVSNGAKLSDKISGSADKLRTGLGDELKELSHKHEEKQAITEASNLYGSMLALSQAGLPTGIVKEIGSHLAEHLHDSTVNKLAILASALVDVKSDELPKSELYGIVHTPEQLNNIKRI
jgi:ankyrin repeat protein